MQKRNSSNQNTKEFIKKKKYIKRTENEGMHILVDVKQMLED